MHHLKVLLFACGFLISWIPREAAAQQQTTPQADAPLAPAPEDQKPQFIFAGQDGSAGMPETFSLKKGTAIGTFTIRTPTGELNYLTNTLTFSGITPATVAGSRFAVYEATGLKVEYAFLVEGGRTNPVYVRNKGEKAWAIEGLFNRHLPRGNNF